MITGELEPSHALVDIYLNMCERNTATKVEWSSLAKREQELQGVKTEATWKLDVPTGMFKVQKEWMVRKLISSQT